jgi:pantoate--beta-alanine ligase
VTVQVIEKAREMQELIGALRAEGKRIGFVPTMGFFHEGHLSLMRAARADDVAVVSIFVNPTQFGPNEDFEAYPRDLERDLNLAEAAGVDHVFHPSPEEMYPQPFLTQVDVRDITGVLCGAARPGHFAGVATVVAKLFHIIPAHRAYFGQKDAQQVAVISRMVRDLNFDVEIVPCPTVREPDGLAMSSRNTYLDPGERQAATVLFRSLREAERLVGGGERDALRIETAMRAILASEPTIKVEYAVLCDSIMLQPVARLTDTVLAAVAVRIGRTRLIDNILLRVEK